MKKILLLLFLLIFSTAGANCKTVSLCSPYSNMLVNIDTKSKNKTFSFIGQITNWNRSCSYVKSFSLNDEEFLIKQKIYKEDSFEYYLFDIKTGKMERGNDEKLQKLFIIGSYDKNKLIFTTTDNQKIGLYDYKTKETVYFKGHSKGKKCLSSLKLNSKFIVEYEKDGKQYGGYEICDVNSFTCKNIPIDEYTPHDLSLAQVLDDNKLMFVYTIYEQEYPNLLSVFDLENNEVIDEELPEDISLRSKTHVVYKKNNICLLNQLSGAKTTELILYEYKNDEFIEKGRYPCKLMSKGITNSAIIAIDEKRILLFGGEDQLKNTDREFAGESLKYLKNAYIFNTETKKYTKIDSLPLGMVARNDIVKAGDAAWIIKGNRCDVIKFNKKGLDD